VLVLDFDGVVCDALGECAAVTWYAGRPAVHSVPGPAAAVELVPPAFLTTFASVRVYSRTLADFMVANALPAGSTVDRAAFAQRRAEVGEDRLDAQARRGEAVRGAWRCRHPEAWLGLHTVHAEVAELLRVTDEPVAIVSAKDAESIYAILGAAGFEDAIWRVVGSCADKAGALTTLAAEAGGEPVVFVDDNLDNALAAARLPGVESHWAYWGYHGPEDDWTAAQIGMAPLSLDDLTRLAGQSAPAGSHQPSLTRKEQS